METWFCFLTNVPVLVVSLPMRDGNVVVESSQYSGDRLLAYL